MFAPGKFSQPSQTNTSLVQKFVNSGQKSFITSPGTGRNDTQKKTHWKWKRINCKQSARWQHLYQLKASAFLFDFFSGVKRHDQLYLRLVMPYSGWWEPSVVAPWVSLFSTIHFFRINSLSWNDNWLNWKRVLIPTGRKSWRDLKRLTGRGSESTQSLKIW